MDLLTICECSKIQFVNFPFNETLFDSLVVTASNFNIQV